MSEPIVLVLSRINIDPSLHEKRKGRQAKGYRQYHVLSRLKGSYTAIEYDEIQELAGSKVALIIITFEPNGWSKY